MKLENFFPFIKWMKAYNKKSFISDIIAGLTVAVILIPQSMAYASIAWLPPIYWLYAWFLWVAIAALWWSSSQLATWPVAIVSFLVLTSLMSIAKPESPEFIWLAITLAIIVWIIQLLMWVFKLGFIMNFVSHSVVIWFSNAAAIIIGVTQIPSLLWIKIGQHEIVFDSIYEIIKNITETNLVTLWIWIISIISILLLRKIHKLFPSALVIIIIWICITYFWDLTNLWVSIIWDIPSGLPKFSFPSINLDNIHNMIWKWVIISIIWFMEAYAISKSIASKTKQKINVNQELIWQWLANIVTWFFKWYPISWSFSRTAVNYSAWAKTWMSSVFSTLFVWFALLFLTQTLYYLPKVILSAIVLVAVSWLVNFKELKSLYKINKVDWISAIVTFSFAFLMKPDYAIFIWIILSLVLFLYKTITPRINEISKEDFTSRFKNIEKYHLSVCPQIMIIKPEMSLYFANTEWILNKITNRIKDRKNDLKYLVLDFESTNYCDISAVELLNIFIEDLKDMNIEIFFVNVNWKIINTFKNTELHYIVDEERILDWKKEVVEKLFPILKKDVCKNCKNRIFNECKTIK